MQRNQFHQQTHDKSTFYDQTVTNSQCIIGRENYPNVAKDCDYEHDKNSEAYVEILSCFRHLSRDNTLQPYFTQNDLNTFFDCSYGPGPGSNLYVVVRRFHQKFVILHPIKLKVDISIPVSASVRLTGYALLLTNKEYHLILMDNGNSI